MEIIRRIDTFYPAVFEVFLMLHALVDCQVSVSSSAAASTKYNENHRPQAYISSLSSSKADPNTSAKIIPGLPTSKPVTTIQRPATNSYSTNAKPTSTVPIATTAAPSKKPTKDIVSKASWDYKSSDESYGPEKWHLLSDRCSGQRQSPIDIVTANAEEHNGPNFPIKFILPQSGQADNFTVKGTLKNNGRALGFGVDSEIAPIKIAFRGLYTLKQFHFHFGCENESGSEHSIDGKRFPGEIHFVFSNDKYSTMENVIQAPDGLLVIAFFLDVDESVVNSEMNKINQLLTEVSLPKEKEAVEEGIQIINLVPALKEGIRNLKWFGYKGSLPAPPCFESVIWMVFQRPVKVKNAILDNWRKMLQGSHNRMCGNFRPVQPLNGRKIVTFSLKPLPTPPNQTQSPLNLGDADL